MSTPIEFWKKWEGRIVDGEFPLRQWLGGSDHSAVFLTERGGKEPRKAAIKIIAAENSGRENGEAALQLSRWTDTAKLSHPHLIGIFASGRCQLDDMRLLYVVTEYAEENLGEILPLRPLSADEASQMLRPTAEVLQFLHQSGYVHGRIRPSNIMAVGDQLKISSDALRKTGERNNARAFGVYDAPEVTTTGPSPAGDVWSLGATLVAVLTQNEPKLKSGELEPKSVPEAIPQPFREIARQCLQVDPQRRCPVEEILARIQPGAVQAPPGPPVKAYDASPPQPAPQAYALPQRSKRWIAIPIVAAALLIAVLIGLKMTGHESPAPATQTSPTTQAPEVPASQSPAPFSENKNPAQKGMVKGNVLQQVLPDVSRSAQNTITGRLKVSVQVQVDSSGNVSQARLVSPGPSRYFASHALEAARRWRFSPPQVDGKAVPSEWLIRFQFGRGSTQVFPAETKP